VVFNLAQCEEHEGRLVDARRHWNDGQAAIDSRDERVTLARDRVAALDKRIPTLTVKLADPGLGGVVIKIDGNATPGPGTPVPLDPGAHVVTMSSVGHKDARANVELAEATQKEIVLVAEALQPAKSAAPPRASDTKRTIGWVVGGVGVAGF